MSYSQIYNRKIFKNINHRGEEEILYLLKEGCNNDSVYDWHSITNNEWYECKTYRSDFASRKHIEKGLSKLADRFSDSKYDGNWFDLEVNSKGYSYKKFVKYLNNYKRYEEELSNNLIEYSYGNCYVGILFSYTIGIKNFIDIEQYEFEIHDKILQTIMSKLSWGLSKEEFSTFKVDTKNYDTYKTTRIHFDIKYASYVQERLGGYIERVNDNFTGRR